MLTPGMPSWVIELAAIAPEIQEAVGRVVVGSVHVRASVPHQDHLTVVLGPVGDVSGVVRRVAEVMSGLWSGWLSDGRVGLEVLLPGVSVRASGDSMVRLAAGEVSSAEWLFGAVRVSRGESDLGTEP